uniref:Uncharacterized protein n=1 Tax=Callorhinchus milii TaxID=7868 RepID=A0A4W3IX60_CALMI
MQRKRERGNAEKEGETQYGKGEAIQRKREAIQRKREAIQRKREAIQKGRERDAIQRERKPFLSAITRYKPGFVFRKLCSLSLSHMV